jgi:predicted acyltransferase
MWNPAGISRMNAPAPQRLLSLDTYRGFVMFLMAAQILQLPDVAAHDPSSAFWRAVGFHTSHVAWTGCSLHDLIQPSFSFMVGVALPFSLAARKQKGAALSSLWGHALLRAFILVMLGVVLRSMGKSQTNWTFEDTLTQIGLGYPFLFALGFASARVRWISFAAILLGYWLFFVLYNGSAVGPKPSDWVHDASGFAAHWNLNANAAWAFDRWFMNLFPRAKEFLGNSGGYSTLNFVPTLATMLLGLIAGQWIKDGPRDARLAKRIAVAGLLALISGYLWQASGLCPVIKKIWTPAWVLVSGGWCFLLMASFFWIIDVRGWQRWAFPLIVIGMNSIAIYVMTWTMGDFFTESLVTHFGRAPFLWLGPVFEPVVVGGTVLVLYWLILWWMHRHRIFIRI